MAQSPRIDDRYPSGPELTEREMQVLISICDGRTSKEIALGLQISPKTVEFHRTNILKKTSSGSVAGLVRWAVRNGVIEP